MSSEKAVADALWTVRTLRVEGADLTAQKVYERQRYLFLHSREEILAALVELGDRGYHWAQRYPDIPDACIIVTPRIVS